MKVKEYTRTHMSRQDMMLYLPLNTHYVSDHPKFVEDSAMKAFNQMQ